MTKLKPLSKLADDVREGDMVRIVYRETQGRSKERVGYYSGGYDDTRRLPSLRPVNHPSFDDEASDSEFTLYLESIKESHSDILGYEILRRAK